jgi:hypothetical protein
MEEHNHNHETEAVNPNVTVEAPETDTPLVDSHSGHSHESGFSVEELIEVMFGLEHVLSEFFWNAVFILATFVITKAAAFRKMHKYIDDKHGVEHKKDEY